jgi:DNA polymerase-3 subunit delta'
VDAALAGELGDAPWRRMLSAAEASGSQAGEETVARAAAMAAEAGQDEGRAARRTARDAEEAGRRAARKARTEALDAGLGLLAAWLRDLAAVADGAEELVLNADRLDALRAGAGGLDARAARRGAELVMDTRRRLQVNVGEELALEALVYRLEALLTSPRNRR